MTAVAVRLTRRPTTSGPVPWFHLVAGEPPHVLLLADSSLFEVEPAFFARLAAGDPVAVAELAAAAPGTTASRFDQLGPLPAPRAISLNVAQACNLSCSYCYADEGRFSGAPRRMTSSVARRAVDDLLAGASAGSRVTVGFIGGEPMLHRALVHDVVGYASARAGELGVSVGFSVTTNGTLLEAGDLDLFRSHPFAVTVSLDGGRETHDRHRHTRDGSGSWDRVVENLRPLLDDPGDCHVSARATVTRDDLDIAGRVAALTAAGFREVGVSPARTGPDPSLLVQGDDWPAYLAGMVEAAEAELRRLRREGPAEGWRFSNLATSLAEIHKGTARPLPCGAAYGYVSVDADGAYATCHRTIGDPRFALGGPGELSDDARRRFLEPRLVDRQEPCRSCWARYLCGGGCHAEVIEAGREGCDMIRGWLDQCLRWYPHVRAEFPELFQEVVAR